jgi:hypothetical protein
LTVYRIFPEGYAKLRGLTLLKIVRRVLPEAEERDLYGVASYGVYETIAVSLGRNREEWVVRFQPHKDFVEMGPGVLKDSLEVRNRLLDEVTGMDSTQRSSHIVAEKSTSFQAQRRSDSRTNGGGRKAYRR